MTGLTDCGGNRKRQRRFGITHQAQTCFMREAIGFEGIYFLLGPHEILEGVAPTSISRHNVIEIAAIFSDVLARVLANTAVALVDGCT